MGDAVAGLFGLSGVMNTVVGAHRNDTAGVSATEQVGVAKVVNVGDTLLVQVGNYHKIGVGALFVIECGASKFSMNSAGEILIQGTTFNFISTGPVQVRGAPIDLNYGARGVELVNRTGFPAAAFRQFDRTGGVDAVVAVRGTFDFLPNAALETAKEQEAFQWEDTYEGDQATVPLMRQGDLVPFKPGTDVTVLATSHCPDPRGTASWPCGVRITGPGGPVLDKQLRITGLRQWRPILRPQLRTLLGVTAPAILQGWELTPPEPARSVDVDWRLAQGGPRPDGTPEPANPVGLGIVTAASPPLPVPAPQIELAAAPLDWQAAPAPAGFGPLAPWYHDRLCHAGTGGLVWLDEHRPVLPADFDERFWQCAPADQIITPYLRGNERFALLNLYEGHPTLSGHLPGVMLGVAVERPGAAPERLALDLDGVHFDLRPGWDRVLLTWRRRMPMPRFAGVRLTLAERVRLGPAGTAT